MEWISDLFFGQGVAHSVITLALVITLGIFLGRIKIAGVSLGITWILFVGILLSHFGIKLDADILHFCKEFGLILFVYSVGMQVGPSFFASFKKGGMTLNGLATSVVFLGVVITYIIHLVTDVPITTMVGIMSGAVTNTPGLGAAQQAYTDMTGIDDPTIAMGYAVAYPLGVVGIICSIILLKFIFRVKIDNELKVVESLSSDASKEMAKITVEINNPNIAGKTISDIAKIIGSNVVISRVLHGGNKMEIGSSKTTLTLGDKVLLITSLASVDKISAVLGKTVIENIPDWNSLDSQFIIKRVLVTKSVINGKSLGSLRIRELFGVNVTRVNRAGTDLIPKSNLELQIGDRLIIVGDEVNLVKVSKLLGNSLKRLNEPNLIAIFLGIFIGIFVGSIPLVFPGIPQPIKLGLAGGPLVVAILVSRFGPHFGLVTYTTLGANLIIREIGISLFLACVGLSAGDGFVDTVANGGYAWIGYGFIITLVPLLIVGFIGRKVFKLNYFTLMGLLAGSTTDPPALAYSNAISNTDLPAVSYATVYPLSMFLRVLSAQLLILILAS